MDADLVYFDDPNDTYSSLPDDSVSSGNVSDNVVFGISILVICIFGAVGNGIVIWLLGFRIKRNPFSTYILNLAVADFGVLLAATFFVADYWVGFIYDTPIIFFVFFFLFLSTYSSSQFLLTAISLDRCVAVFFPLWHRCHRPPHLSTIVCALIWVLVLFFLLTAVTCTLKSVRLHVSIIEESYQFIVNAVLCLPVMTIATVSLFIKACLKARQHRRGRLLTVILLTLLFFLLFAFPFNIMHILTNLIYLPIYMSSGALLLACLNSSINPVIYFLVGRQWKSSHREGMKMILQKVFKEEEGCVEETTV
ncbi:PREDICTED: mas-related G-protein coupled receptor member H-like [Gekko japonicus]|uniref:Mas-related G-protein coupled receptor member H-like n=1 Tax=Gekko japonicus TaxID=146911 RepID=A0ABM1L6E5_GEKJA|nr:PREDICTED: mas-related G-protein coupled receptor member H-like [Gekko japonicus]